VKRSEANFPITNIDSCKTQMLHWGNQCNICVILDNHQYTSAFQKTEYLVAAGAVQTFSNKPASLAALSRFIHEEADWLFGHINYDFKYSNGPSISPHHDPIGFPDIFFFQPETILQLTGNTLTIASSIKSPAEIWQELIHTKCGDESSVPNNLLIQSRISEKEYLQTIEQLLQHIKRGDCYELNFCQEFFASDALIDPISTYQQLTKISPNPFAAFYKLENKYVLCASPERFLQKKNNRLVSQPIKGTYQRNTIDPVADDALKLALKNSEKDKSENVMVVDLVRNDLSKVCL
jgi:para-aminobenzoate synthetase component 1